MLCNHATGNSVINRDLVHMHTTSVVHMCTHTHLSVNALRWMTNFVKNKRIELMLKRAHGSYRPAKPLTLTGIALVSMHGFT